MDTQLKLTSWNSEYLDRLIDNPADPKKKKRLDAISQEIFTINPDILCLIEGPRSEQRIDDFCNNFLQGKYKPIKEANQNYKQKGIQWIWFLVKPSISDRASLLSPDTWDSFAGAKWDVNYWGNFLTETHSHYRHPQVLIFNWKGSKGELRMEFIGLHTKSKFINGGESAWKAGGAKQQQFIKDAIEARIKMTTEISNVRNYIDKKFEQVANPAIFVLGDLNDGPGKEYFEEQYLFFDLLSNVEGNIFEAKKYLNHALFDFDEGLRWTCQFDDFVDSVKDKKILLDHILFTQGLVDETLPVLIEEKSGYVEHEIHDLVNSTLPNYAKTSDHKPVSLIIRENTDILIHN
jgi:hypothetical protein